MKLATVAVALATVATFANAATCPASELQKLLGLARAPRLEECQNDSTFTFIPPSGMPTADQVTLMCASEACRGVIKFLQGLNPADCELTFSNNVTLNVKKILDTTVPTCKV